MFIKHRNSNKAFTLIELLVVVAIIGIFSGVVLASLNSAREKGRLAAGKQFDANTLHSIGDQLVAEWKFDESTNRYLDTSGSGHNGSCSNCPTVATGQGFNGKDAMSFDGVDDLINFGTGNNYLPLNTFTVCSWVKTPGLATGMTASGIFSLTYGLTTYINSSGNFVSRVDNGSTFVNLSINKNLNDNQYHHLCLNFDGVNRNMYIDGALGLSTATTWLGTTRWPASSVAVGVDVNTPSSNIFYGLIDDVRLYSSALNIAQINKLYAEGIKEIKLANNR